MLMQSITSSEITSPGRRPALSLRQRQVLHLLATGATRQEVGRKLVLSEGTVNTHVSMILQRLGAHNVTHAVYLAACQRLLPLEDANECLARGKNKVMRGAHQIADALSAGNDTGLVGAYHGS